MTQKTRNTIKTFFETGKIPSQEQYIDLIDSQFNIIEPNSGSLKLSGSLDVSGSNNTIGSVKIGSGDIDNSTELDVFDALATGTISWDHATLNGLVIINGPQDKREQLEDWLSDIFEG